MARFYLQLTDQNGTWTMVHIDDDDDKWDQRSMQHDKDSLPTKPIRSGSGDAKRLLQYVSLFDGDSGEKVVQLYVGNGQRFQRGAKGSGIAGGARPTLKDGPIEWNCTAYYD